VLLYADAYQLPPGQQMSDRALQALGLGYTGVLWRPRPAFGNTLTTEGRGNLVASSTLRSSSWSVVERKSNRTFSRGDTYSSAPSTSMARTASHDALGHAPA